MKYDVMNFQSSTKFATLIPHNTSGGSLVWDLFMISQQDKEPEESKKSRDEKDFEQLVLEMALEQCIGGKTTLPPTSSAAEC